MLVDVRIRLLLPTAETITIALAGLSQDMFSARSKFVGRHAIRHGRITMPYR